MKHFKDFGSGFTEIHTKHDADTLLDFAIHRKQNKAQSQESTLLKTVLFHSVVLSGRLMH
jgi:hypothetical protein